MEVGHNEVAFDGTRPASAGCLHPLSASDADQMLMMSLVK